MDPCVSQTLLSLQSFEINGQCLYDAAAATGHLGKDYQQHRKFDRQGLKLCLRGLRVDAVADTSAHTCDPDELHSMASFLKDAMRLCQASTGSYGAEPVVFDRLWRTMIANVGDAYPAQASYREVFRSWLEHKLNTLQLSAEAAHDRSALQLLRSS